MSSERGCAIRLEGVGKKYRIRHQASAHYTALRDVVGDALKRVGRRAFGKKDGRPATREDFWALQDISLDIQQGERLGIIGRNGAGKSTLLKLISRITAPTTGRIRLRGRVGSLLEVGTGFHPELTGRENIFLNGAILGMSRQEIRRRFDEIVAFAEVEKFLDTPVKRYSSGMYVRLAFAVAAHLGSDILLVDEVLAVGDSQFQAKCLGKMSDISIGQGRTIIFVSHNLAAIKNLCTRGLLLERGRLVMLGTPGDVIERYVLDPVVREPAVTVLAGFPRTAGNQEAILEAWMENGQRQVTRDVLMGSAVDFCFRFKADHPLQQPGFGFGIETVFGQRVFALNNYVAHGGEHAPIMEGVAHFHVPEMPLLPGKYFVSLSLVENNSKFVDFAERAIQFHVVENDVFGTGKMLQGSQGLVYVKGTVTVNRIGAGAASARE
jgi:lipopolysaccharide transport system ATP-binding protein